MTIISRSPNKNDFRTEQARRIIDENPNDTNAIEIIDIYSQWEEDIVKLESSSEWQKDNLEYDLRSTIWICEKVRESNVYSQNLYAAMCNREFQKLDVFSILADRRWGCSWRQAGGIIADIRGYGGYIDWYCSGIAEQYEFTQGEWDDLTIEQQEFQKEREAFVPEGVATYEIIADLKKLGWAILDEDISSDS